MKIEPFKMEVTPEQSRRVQEIVFRNGYAWYGGSRAVMNEQFKCLFFEDDTLTVSNSIHSVAGLPIITFADFMARYGGAETTPFDIMRKIVTIAEAVHKNDDIELCYVLLDALADYISNNRPE